MPPINKINLNQTADKIAINELLSLYCHGVDRCDLESLTEVFWDDGIADYGSGPVPAKDFCNALVPALQSMTLTQHNIGNVLIQINGDTAKVQTNCVAFHIISTPANGEIEMEVGGRYLDKMEKRGDIWRIFNRTYVMDWNRNGVASMQTEEGLYADLKHRGQRRPGDLSGQFFN